MKIVKILFRVLGCWKLRNRRRNRLRNRILVYPIWRRRADPTLLKPGLLPLRIAGDPEAYPQRHIDAYYIWKQYYLWFLRKCTTYLMTPRGTNWPQGHQGHKLTIFIWINLCSVAHPVLPPNGIPVWKDGWLLICCILLDGKYAKIFAYIK